MRKALPGLRSAVEAPAGTCHDFDEVVGAPLTLHLLHKVLDVPETVGNCEAEDRLTAARITNLSLGEIGVFQSVELQLV